MCNIKSKRGQKGGSFIIILIILLVIWWLPTKWWLPIKSFLKELKENEDNQSIITTSITTTESLKSDSKVTWNDFNQNFSQLENSVNQTLSLIKEKTYK